MVHVCVERSEVTICTQPCLTLSGQLANQSRPSRNRSLNGSDVCWTCKIFSQTPKVKFSACKCAWRQLDGSLTPLTSVQEIVHLNPGQGTAVHWGLLGKVRSVLPPLKCTLLWIKASADCSCKQYGLFHLNSLCSRNLLFYLTYYVPI